MYVLNVPELRMRLKQKGFSGLVGLLRKLGLHRNALSRYVAGHPVLPNSLSRVIEELGLNLDKILMIKNQKTSPNDLSVIMPLVNQLRKKSPDCSFFLFGSRAKNSNRKYSDFDIGVIKASGLGFSEYQGLLEQKEIFEEQSPYYVDLVDLARADVEFLRPLIREAKLLAGDYVDLLNLIKSNEAIQ